MTTIAAIAAEALDAVALDITDAVAAATITRPSIIGYDPIADQQMQSSTSQDGRAVFCNMSAAEGLFPGYIASPSDQLLLLEGFATVRQNDVVTIGGVARTIHALQDIGGAGSLFYAVAR